MKFSNLICGGQNKKLDHCSYLILKKANTTSTMLPAHLSTFCPLARYHKPLKSFRLCVLYIIAVLGAFGVSSSQRIDAQVDTAYFETLYDTVNIYLDNDIANAYPILDRYITESRKSNYHKGILYGLQDLGWWFKQSRAYEQADSAYYLALSLAKLRGDYEDEGYTYRQMADVSKRAGRSFEMIDRFKLSLESYKKAEDEHWVCKMYNIIGQHLNDIDDHAKALEYLEKGVDLCGKINYQEFIAYNQAAAGVVYAKMEDYDRADSLYALALDRLKAFPEDPSIVGISNNRAILLKNRGQLEEALASYNQLLKDPALCGPQLPSLLSNRSEVYLLQKNFEAAENDMRQAVKIFDSEQNLLGGANAYNVLAKAYHGLKQFENAKRSAFHANDLATKASSLDKLKDNYKIQAAIFESTGEYGNALQAQRNYMLYKDSLYNIDYSKIVEQQQRKLGASIERSENALLKAQLELSKAKRGRLRLVALGLGILGIIGIAFLYYKRNKEKQIFHQEALLQQQRLENQELQKEKLRKDLVLKKQELLASALQIQNKNEVLSKLNTQISEIESKVSHSNIDLQRISRQINQDLESNSEWDRFIQSFSEVHVDFVNRLNREHPDLSRHQVRLLCLMKMNLSSREIGNILNISSEGVKKARYRVKKKLGLTNEHKIGDFLNDFVEDHVA